MYFMNQHVYKIKRVIRLRICRIIAYLVRIPKNGLTNWWKSPHYPRSAKPNFRVSGSNSSEYNQQVKSKDRQNEVYLISADKRYHMEA